MKKLLIAIIVPLTFLTVSLKADEDRQEDHFNATQLNDYEDADHGPFTVDAYYDYIGKSKFKKRGFKHDHIRFSAGAVEAGVIVYFNKELHEAINVIAGYANTDIHWKENPFFKRKSFNTASVAVGAITKRMPNWLWKGKLIYSIDIDHPNVNEYSVWDFLAWGRHTYCDNVGVHIGLLVFTGMKIDRVYPILGFDWAYDKNWKINAVFPVNISLVYDFNNYWSMDLAARGWWYRYRVGKHENLRKALTEYSNIGLEYGVNYDMDHTLHANAHIGYTTGGRLKIANHGNHHNRHFRFEGAPYAGAELEVNF